MSRSQRKKRLGAAIKPATNTIEDYLTPPPGVRPSSKMDSTKKSLLSSFAPDDSAYLLTTSETALAHSPEQPPQAAAELIRNHSNTPPLILPTALEQFIRKQDLQLAMTTWGKSFQDILDSLQLEIATLKTDLLTQQGKMKAAETTILQLELTVSTLSSQLNITSSKLPFIEQRQENAERRARQNGVRILGIPEYEEGGDCAAFIASYLNSADSNDTLSKPLSIANAQRLPIPRPPSGSPPRPVIVTLLTCRDKESILRIARRGQLPDVKSSKILIYPDYTQKTQLLRKTFAPIKAKLRALGLKYTLLYPARLRVLHGNESLIFPTLESAWKWLDEEHKELERRAPTQNQQPQRAIRRERPDQASNDSNNFKDNTSKHPNTIDPKKGTSAPSIPATALQALSPESDMRRGMPPTPSFDADEDYRLPNILQRNRTSPKTTPVSTETPPSLLIETPTPPLIES